MKTPYKSYAEKLRDPRWQELRLRVMDRDGFTCKECEYPMESLETLCEECHRRITEETDFIMKAMGADEWLRVMFSSLAKAAQVTSDPLFYGVNVLQRFIIAVESQDKQEAILWYGRMAAEFGIVALQIPSKIPPNV